MTNPLAEISNQITKLKADLLNMKNQEFSKVVALSDRIRVLNDVTPRTAVYGPISLTVAGFTGLPTRITAVYCQFYLVGNSAANQLQVSVRSADTAFLPVVAGGKLVASGDVLTGFSLVKLGATGGANYGQLIYTLISGTYSQFIIDVVGYVI